MRSFVQLDVDGNVVATLESARLPGDHSLEVLPANFIEVTDRTPEDWSSMRWTGSAFESRPDIGV